MTLRALVVDDEPIARRRLRALLEDDPRVDVVGECENGFIALETIRRLHPDLVFLDIQMPGLDGFEVVELLEPTVCPAVIFVTAYDKYAVRAFDVCAADYLLKPFERRRLAAAVSRAVVAAGRSEHPSRLPALMDNLRATRPLRRFLVRSTRGAYTVPLEDVEAIESADHYVELQTRDKTHLVRESLSGLERRLDPASFVRIHRTTIVNLAAIRELCGRLHGEAIVVLMSGRRVRCSRTYAATLKDAVGSG